MPIRVISLDTKTIRISLSSILMDPIQLSLSSPLSPLSFPSVRVRRFKKVKTAKTGTRELRASGRKSEDVMQCGEKSQLMMKEDGSLVCISSSLSKSLGFIMSFFSLRPPFHSLLFILSQGFLWYFLFSLYRIQQSLTLPNRRHCTGKKKKRLKENQQKRLHWLWSLCVYRLLRSPTSQSPPASVHLLSPGPFGYIYIRFHYRGARRMGERRELY